MQVNELQVLVTSDDARDHHDAHMTNRHDSGHGSGKRDEPRGRGGRCGCVMISACARWSVQQELPWLPQLQAHSTVPYF